MKKNDRFHFVKLKLPPVDADLMEKIRRAEQVPLIYTVEEMVEKHRRWAEAAQKNGNLSLAQRHLKRMNRVLVRYQKGEVVATYIGSNDLKHVPEGWNG